MPYTTNIRLSVQIATSNPGTWGADGTQGDDLNTGVMGIIDTRLAEPVTFSVSSSNVTLSYAHVQSCMFRFTGTLLANITVSPDTGGSPIAASYFNGMYGFDNATTGNFTITLQTSNGSVVLPQGRRGIVYVSNANSLAPRIVAIAGSAVADPIPTGARTLFYNTAAPAGWTAVALNDYAIKIVTEGGGGVTSGSVAYSTLYARTATDATTLTVDQIPLHGHPFRSNISGGSGVNADGGFAYRNDAPTNFAAYTGTLDNTAGHQIGGTGGGASHTHNIDMRVFTAAFTLATKD